MSFMNTLAKVGTFGLAGMGASAMASKKPKPTMATTTTGGSTIDPSLINSKSIY